MKKKTMIARGCFIAVRVRLILFYSTMTFGTEISGANGKQCYIVYFMELVIHKCRYVVRYILFVCNTLKSIFITYMCSFYI